MAYFESPPCFVFHFKIVNYRVSFTSCLNFFLVNRGIGVELNISEIKEKCKQPVVALCKLKRADKKQAIVDTCQEPVATQCVSTLYNLCDKPYLLDGRNYQAFYFYSKVLFCL